MGLFHIAENQCLDIMHDLFEGVARYVIEKVLTSLICVQKAFTLSTVNYLIESFPYSEFESQNKPRPLTIETKVNKIEQKIIGVKSKIRAKQSAVEMACLSRYLGLMIGDLVPDGYQPWQLYLLLRKIIGTVTAPRFVDSDIFAAKQYIKDFLTLFH